jgi:hypothetical protein
MGDPPSLIGGCQFNSIQSLPIAPIVKSSGAPGLSKI